MDSPVQRSRRGGCLLLAVLLGCTWADAGEEMIIDPECIKSENFRFLPNIFEFRDRGILLGNLQAKADLLACFCCMNLRAKEESRQDP